MQGSASSACQCSEQPPATPTHLDAEEGRRADTRPQVVDKVLREAPAGAHPRAVQCSAGMCEQAHAHADRCARPRRTRNCTTLPAARDAVSMGARTPCLPIPMHGVWPMKLPARSRAGWAVDCCMRNMPRGHSHTLLAWPHCPPYPHPPPLPIATAARMGKACTAASPRRTQAAVPPRWSTVCAAAQRLRLR